MQQPQLRSDPESSVFCQHESYHGAQKRKHRLIYKCLKDGSCKVKNKSKSFIIQHRKKCIIRSQIKIQQAIAKKSEQKQRLMEQEMKRQKQQMQAQTKPTIDVQNLSLQEKVNFLLRFANDSLKKPNNLARTRASQIVIPNIEAIQAILISRLAQVFQKIDQMNFNKNKNNQIANQLLLKIQRIELTDLIYDFSSLLKEADQKIQRKNHLKCSKTKRNNRRCYNFISKYSEVQLLVPNGIYLDLVPLQSNFLAALRAYWRQVKMTHQYFSKFPELPHVFKLKQARVSRIAQISLQQATNQIVRQYLIDPFITADMYIIMTMALRHSDLLKLTFQSNQTGQFFKTIRLNQGKNLNDASRYIPKPLIQLIIASKAVYPMTDLRIIRAKSKCLQLFHSAYGFKHRALSVIVAQLYKSSAFAQMHKNSSTTVRYYLNKNEQDLLDQAFKLGINFQFSSQMKMKIQNRKYELNVIGSSPRQIQLKEEAPIQISIDCRGIQAQIQTAALDGNLLQVKFQQLQEQEVREMVIVGGTHHNQLRDNIYSNFSSLIQQQVSRQDLLRIQHQIEQKSSASLSESYIDQLSQMTKRQIYYYDLKSQSNETSLHYKPQMIREDRPPIVIVKTHEGIKSTTNQMQAQVYLPRVPINGFKNFHGVKAQLTNINPYCRFCERDDSLSKLDFEFKQIKCKKCGKDSYFDNEEVLNDGKIKIYHMKDSQIKGFSKVKLLTKENNLKQTIQKDFKCKFDKKSIMTYAFDLPKYFKTKYPTFDSKTSQMIKCVLQNEDKLPLQIRQSTVGGKGVFATQLIQRNTLIAVYKGKIGTNFTIKAEGNDSIFTLGYLKGSVHFEVLLDGRENVNVGRYINSSQGSYDANLTPGIGIYNNHIVLFFVAKTAIQPKDQLKYYYGNKYWGKKKQLIEQ